MSWTQLSDFILTSHFQALEKEMSTHSSILAWRIPGTGEPGGLLSMGSHRVGHDWSDLAAAASSSESYLRKTFKQCIQLSLSIKANAAKSWAEWKNTTEWEFNEAEGTFDFYFIYLFILFLEKLFILIGS